MKEKRFLIRMGSGQTYMVDPGASDQTTFVKDWLRPLVADWERVEAYALFTLTEMGKVRFVQRNEGLILMVKILVTDVRENCETPSYFVMINPADIEGVCPVK